MIIELQKFIDFYSKKGHKMIPNYSLKPDGDSTLLFTNSGMFPLVPYLLGEKHPLGKRIFNIQRCLRVDDIEDIGDRRHTTCFEMIGNWSLGDYFKEEQLNQWFEFCVDVLGIDINRLYATVFAGNKLVPCDIESIEILKNIYKSKNINADFYPISIYNNDDIKEEIDFKKYKIFAYSEKKNWWKRGDAIGELGGPDSELFYDTGAQHNPKYGKYCHPNCDCGKFIEIGNSVFMQYRKTKDGWEEISQKNVDFGGGFERILMACRGAKSIFDTDLYLPMINYLEQKTNKKYLSNIDQYSYNVFDETDKAFEIIVDHIKASVFIIADDIIPSNKEQGYVLRRLIRRAVRYIKKLQLNTDSLLDIASICIDTYKDRYTHFDTEKILKVLFDEKNKFEKTIDLGLKEFNKSINKLNNNLKSGNTAFYFFETYGFPLEMYIEELNNNKIEFDIDKIKSEFESAKNAHIEQSRNASSGMFKGGLADHSDQVIKYHTATHLLLYALRKVLGDHVVQKGSNNTAERLRFDFFHHSKLTDEQIKQVEKIVNDIIKEGCDVKKIEMSYNEAINNGIIGIYKPNTDDEKISVYCIGDYSKEICGGPHVSNTSVLGNFKIIKEESISANTRRIKAILY